MYLVLLAALTAVCSAEKLDRAYLPPATAKTAGGSPGSLQTPFSDYYQGPVGSYDNGAQGVVVDAASPGTRASLGPEESGLGGPRTSYGSTASKVGDAAFKDSLTGFNQYPKLLKSIPLEDQDPEYQTSIPKVEAIQTKLLQPQDSNDHNSNILTYENNVDTHKYNYGFASDNGIVVGEKGVAHDGVQAQGGYSYKGNDGKVYKVTYTADKDGYQPQGDHLPKPPPIPEDIRKSIEKNTKEEASGIVDDGSYDSQKYNAEGDYKESDTNKYNTQQSQFEKRPEYDAPVNGASIIQNSVPTSGLTGNSGFSSGSSDNQPSSAFGTGLSNIFNSQLKPTNTYGQGPQGSSAGSGQFPHGSLFKPQTQPTGFGTQFTQQGLKPQVLSPTLSQFSSFPTIQPGQFGSQFNTQQFQKPELKPTSDEILSQHENTQGLQDSQLNTHLVSSDAPSFSKPTIQGHNSNSKPFGSSFASTTTNFEQEGQTGSVNNAYLPPSTNNINEKPLQGILPHKTSVSSTPDTSPKNPVGTTLNTIPQSSQSNLQAPSTLSSTTATGAQPVFGFQTPQVLNVYQQPFNTQSTTFTQSTNNKLSSSQGQAPFIPSIQKYPQQSDSHGFQQQKPIAGTQSPSSSSILSTPAPSNQSPYGTATTTGQVSQFGNYFSNTPVTTQTFPPTSPSFTSSNPPSYKPFTGSSNTQDQTLVLPSQQVSEKDKFTQSTTSTEHKVTSESSQNKPSFTQNASSTQFPVSSQQFHGVDHSYYYNQPTKPFSTPATSPQVSSFPISTSSQNLQGNQPPNFSPLQGSQKQQSFVTNPVSNTQAQLTPTSSVNIKPSQPSYTSVTQVAPSPLPSQSSTSSTLFPQKPVQQSFSQSSTIQKLSTNEVSQLGQNNVIASPVSNKPSQILQNYTPQSSQTQQYNGQLYDYKKPAQELAVTTNKDSATSIQKPQNGQIHSGSTSTLVSQQFHKETTSQLDTSRPQVGQTSLPQYSNTHFTNTQATSQELSKPGSTQFGSQSYKPFTSTSQFGSQPFKPFTATNQFNTQPLKPFGSTFQSGTQTYKPFGSTTQTGTQTYKPFGSTTQTGTQTYKPFGSTTQTGTQTNKPFGSTVFEAQPVKTTGSSFQSGTQPTKPFESTSQFGTQQAKPSGTTSQFGTQSYKPFESTSQFGSQQTKPSGTTSQFGTQSYKPFGSTSQFGTQQTKPSGTTSQFGTQSYKPFGSTSQFGNQQTKPSGTTSQFGTQSYKPFGSTYKPFGSSSQLGSEPVKPQINQEQQSFQGQPQTGTVFSTQSGSQPATPISVASTATPQAQIGGQTTKPQFSQLGQNVNIETVNTGQFGAQPQVSQPIFGTAQSTSSQVQNQYSVQSVKPVITTQTGEQQTTQQQLVTQSNPQFGQTHVTTSNQQLLGTESKPQSGQTHVTTSNHQHLGTQSKPQSGQTHLTSSLQQFGTQSKPQIGQTLLSTSNQQQLGTQFKPQSGQTHLTTSNSLQGTVPQTQFPAQTYKPFGTVSSSSSGGSLTQIQSGIQDTKPHETSKKGGSINAGDFNTSPSSQTLQGSAQITDSQNTKTQFGGEPTKPVTTQTQQQQTTKNEFGAQNKLQLSQNQQTGSNNQQQPYVNNAFGSHSQNAFESSTPYNIGAQQTKNQLGGNAFPNFGVAHATASASSQSFPGFQFGYQPFGNTFKSRFGQNIFPSHSSASASASSGPGPYEYNTPTPQTFVPHSGQPYKYFGGSSTPVFPSVPSQFGQPTTPYPQKQSSFESVQGSSIVDQIPSSQFNSQTIKPPSATQVPIIPQALPSKPESSLGATCCKATQLTQTNQNAPSYASTAAPTVQSSIHSQTPQDLTIEGQKKPEKETFKGEKFDGTKHPQRFDEKTGYYY